MGVVVSRRERDQFRDISAVVGLVQIPAMLDLHVAADRPAQLLQTLQERRAARLRHGIAGRLAHEHADPPDPLALCTRRERPRRRAAHERDEVAPLHSLTSSASASSFAGTSRPSALAATTLMTSSYRLGISTGKSPGFVPLRMGAT